MTDCRDILRVSIPMCLGTLASSASAVWSSPLQNGYIQAAVSTTLLCAGTATVLQQKTNNGNIHRFKVLWVAIMFLAGIFCHSTGIIILPGEIDERHFTGLHSGIARLISEINFKDRENNALVEAILLGDKSSLSGKSIADFRKAGAAHLLALSGMHLGIIYLIVNKALCLLGNSLPSRKIRNVTIVILTGLYTLLCGAGASLVRAWLFILLNETAKMLDRPQPPAQIFCSALTIHIIFNPESISDIGFRLSYLAMVGIIFVWPHMRKWYKDEDAPGTVGSIIWDASALSISCQLFTAPLTLLYFGTFPKYFLITNLIAAPLMTVVMCSSLCALTLTGIWPECPSIIPEICELPLTALRGLLETVAGLG